MNVAAVVVAFLGGLASYVCGFRNGWYKGWRRGVEDATRHYVGFTPGPNWVPHIAEEGRKRESETHLS